MGGVQLLELVQDGGPNEGLFRGVVNPGNGPSTAAKQAFFLSVPEATTKLHNGGRSVQSSCGMVRTQQHKRIRLTPTMFGTRTNQVDSIIRTEIRFERR